MVMISDARPKEDMASFTTAFSEHLRALVGTLPASTATLEIGGDSDVVTFAISPRNQYAAIIKGEASSQGGINFRVGRATTAEVSSSREQWFFQVCEAVFRSHFTESVSYSSTGRILYSRIELEKNGQKLRLGGHQLFWWLFRNRRNEQFSYEPY
jgi:hypothetical protein